MKDTSCYFALYFKDLEVSNISLREKRTGYLFNTGEVAGRKIAESIGLEVRNGNSTDQVIFQFVQSAYLPGCQSGLSSFSDLLDVHYFPH